MKVITLAMVLAACGGGAAKRETTGNTADGSAATARVPCPDEAQVKAIADKAWSNAGSEFGAPECGTFVRGGEAFWIIAGYTNGSEATEEEGPKVLRRLLLVTPKGDVEWSDDEEYESYQVEHFYEGNFRGVDLDGDGVDELLHDGTSDHHGEIVTYLSVAKLEGQTLEMIAGEEVMISQDNSAAIDEEGEQAVTCEGVLTFVPAGKGQRIHVEYTGDHCEQKTVTVELRDGTLVVAN
jgi:hypothetical protein